MEEKQTVSNNQPLEYTIELVEGDISEKPNIKDYKIELVEDEIKTQEEETNLGQISEARKPFWKRIKEVSNNTLPILKTSVFSKIKSGSKKIKDVITSAIDKFVEKNAWYEYREGKIAESAAKLVSDARGLEVQKAQLQADQGKLAAGQAQLQAAQKELEDAKAQLQAAQEKLEAGQAQLQAAQKELEAGQAQLRADQDKFKEMVITDVLKARREMLGLDETVPEERIKAEEYMCTRFRCLRKQLEEYYIKYFGKDTEVQVDSEEKKQALDRLRGRLIAELALLSGILNNNESFILRYENGSEISLEKLKKKISVETEGFFSEYIWTRGEAARHEMKVQYIEGIKELIRLGVYSSVDFEIKTIDSNEIWKQLLESGNDRTNKIAVNCEPGFFTDNYAYINVAHGARWEHTERIVHPGHDDISRAVEKTISFLEENDDELGK